MRWFEVVFGGFFWVFMDGSFGGDVGWRFGVY